MRGIVSKVRYERGRCSCKVIDGKKEYSFYSKESLPQGSAVVVEGEEKEEPTCVIVLSGKEADEVHQEVKRNMAETLKIPEKPVLKNDEISIRLWPGIKKVATELLCAKKLGRNFILHFHGDADGIAGALALTNVFRCKAHQQNSAVYSVRDAFRDIGLAEQEGRPLVVLLDFGSNDASLEGLELLKAAGTEVIIIDHHPPGKNKDILNSCTISPDASKYTAGYLACEIAICCGVDRDEGEKLAKIACAGDKSDLLGSDSGDVEKAMVLDYLAAHISFGNNLDFYRKVMANEKLFSSIVMQAKESIAEAADRAMQQMKIIENGVKIVTFQLDNIVKKGEWPPASKITTCVFERLSKDEGIVCIGYTERSLIMRLNDLAAVKLSVNELAKEILQTMPDFTEGGGGHVKAGAIRVKIGFVKDVLGELIRKIKEKN
ncbi:DHH family phosphoesterase [Candidatus Micrarchaeota archaeon]|nr:DHH family phosphoesterase [Candidatus Micrarchaeota archaeon]